MKHGNDEWNEYWEVLKSGKSTYIKNSSAQFVLHIHHSLKKNGRTGFVSDRGILNNGCDKATTWESKLRKFMFENNNVYKIIFLPTGAFSYTNFQTCIIFMEKNKKTKKCELYNAVFRIPKDKTSEIYVEEKPIKVFTLKELRDCNYSVKIEEVKEEMNKGWVKLGDVCNMFSTTKYCTSVGKKEGIYRFYSSSQTDKLYLDTFEIDKECIIIGNGGTANIHYDIKFTPSKHVTACYINDDNINEYSIKYIYIYFRLYINLLENKFSGGGLKWLNREKIKSLYFPSISLAHQEEIVEFLDNQFRLYNIDLITSYTKDINLFEILLHKKYDLFAYVLHIIYRKIEANIMHEKFEMDKKQYLL